jgi:hypothetical protein
LASTAVRNYTCAIDFTLPASRATGEKLPPAVPGGPPPQPGNYNQTITSDDRAWGATAPDLGDAVGLPARCGPQ